MADIIEIIEQEVHRVLNLSVHKRRVSFPEHIDAVRVAMGIRRAGKSYVMAQEFQKLVSLGAQKEQFFALNFEDERLEGFTSSMLTSAIQKFYEKHPENFRRMTYFLFDEVHEIEGWSKLVRRLFEEKNKTIYVTGSSAKMLSKEIASSLRGRSFSREIFPYNFLEYLDAKENGLSWPEISPNESRALAVGKLINYLRSGGFPALIHLDESNRLQMLRGYIDTIVVRDIIERYNVSNPQILRHLVNTLINSCASLFSLNKFYNCAKSLGYRVGKDTLYEYLSHVEDAFFSFAVPIFGDSLRKAESNPKKMYLSDFGFMHLYGFETENIGRRFENLVYLDLRRSGYEIFYHRNLSGTELDFVAISATNRKRLIQVCFDASSPSTLEREMNGLQEAKKELGIEGILVTPENYLEFLSLLVDGSPNNV